MGSEFSWKNHEFSKIDPGVAHRSLEKVRIQYGDLKSEHIVEVARDPKHPLHNAFPWDDSVAAQIGRESIAARLVRSIRVAIITPERKEIVTRAFVSIKSPDSKGQRAYVTVTATLDDPEGRAYMIRQAWLQLRAWRRRYAELSELAMLHDAIDRAEELSDMARSA